MRFFTPNLHRVPGGPDGLLTHSGTSSREELPKDKPLPMLRIFSLLFESGRILQLKFR